MTKKAAMQAALAKSRKERRDKRNARSKAAIAICASLLAGKQITRTQLNALRKYFPAIAKAGEDN